MAKKISTIKTIEIRKARGLMYGSGMGIYGQEYVATFKIDGKTVYTTQCFGNDIKSLRNAVKGFSKARIIRR